MWCDFVNNFLFSRSITSGNQRY